MILRPRSLLQLASFFILSLCAASAQTAALKRLTRLTTLIWARREITCQVPRRLVLFPLLPGSVSSS